MSLLGRFLSKMREDPLFWMRRVRPAFRRALGWQSVLVYTVQAKEDPAAPSLVDLDLDRCRETARFPEFPWPDPGVWESRLAEHHRLLAVEQDGNFVCYGWVSDQSEFAIGELQGTLSLDQPCIWIWDCVTPQRWRGKGYYPAMLKAIMNRYAGRTIVIYVRKENLASIRGIEKAGFERWIEITAHRFGHRVQDHQLIHLGQHFLPGSRT